MQRSIEVVPLHPLWRMKCEIQRELLHNYVSAAGDASSHQLKDNGQESDATTHMQKKHQTPEDNID